MFEDRQYEKINKILDKVVNFQERHSKEIVFTDGKTGEKLSEADLVKIDKNILDALNFFDKEGTVFDGKELVLNMQKLGSKNYKQTEYGPFFVEEVFNNFVERGEKIQNMDFDIKVVSDGEIINGDIKTVSLSVDGAKKKLTEKLYLNDKFSTDSILKRDGKMFLVIVGVIVKQESDDGEFRKWHLENIKKKKSKYSQKRDLAKNSRHRKYKTAMAIKEILLVEINSDNFSILKEIGQGRNSNGKPRKSKYSASYEDLKKNALVANFIY